jgi:O-acetyl-ADP-ribose deacetylase (regulator of RNase III)
VDNLAPIKTGEAVLTQGFKLPAKYIIHTAGPIYHDGKHGEEQLLRNAYTNSLTCAIKNGCSSIAFPLISSGAYGYPEIEAIHVALSAIRGFIQEQDIKVFLVIFDNVLFRQAISLGGTK